jgi:hypothetical protein
MKKVIIKTSEIEARIVKMQRMANAVSRVATNGDTKEIITMRMRQC